MRDHKSYVQYRSGRFTRSHLEDGSYDLKVLNDVVRGVQEEAGDHAVKALRLPGRAVDFHKIARAHAHAPVIPYAGPRQYIRNMCLHGGKL